MKLVYFISHPEVVIDPQVPVPDWPLSEIGIKRMKAMLTQPWVSSISSVYSSSEKKAVDGAEILASHLGLKFGQIEAVGEMDRSSTGYLPKEEFWAVVKEFFAHPAESIQGWESAIGAKNRIVKAIKAIIAGDSSEGNIAVVSHGGVGALLLTHLSDAPISQEFDQPGDGGGNYFCFEAENLSLVSGWQPIDAT